MSTETASRLWRMHPRNRDGASHTQAEPASLNPPLRRSVEDESPVLMTTAPKAGDVAAARHRAYAAQLAPALVQAEGLDPAHAASVVSRLMLRVSFTDEGAMSVIAADGSESTIIAELARAKAAVPFADADKPVVPVKRDLATAAGRRAAESDAAYAIATSDGNPFKKRYWNLTHQTMIAKKDPDLARRMKEAAGGK